MPSSCCQGLELVDVLWLFRRKARREAGGERKEQQLGWTLIQSTHWGQNRTIEQSKRQVLHENI